MHVIKLCAALLLTALAAYPSEAQATVCGNGVVEAGEQCEPALSPFSCSPSCEQVSSASCTSCGSAACADALIAGCSPVGGTQGSQLCFDMLECVYGSNCFDDASSLMSQCYCGSLPPATCGTAPLPSSGLPGAPNGPCALIIQQAMGRTSNMQPLILADSPGGYAADRLICEKSNCPQPCSFSAPAVTASVPASPVWMLIPLVAGLLGAGAARVSRRRA